MSETPYVGTTIMPHEFLPAIGAMIVHHASLDNQISITVAHLAGMDRNIGISVLSKSPNMATRVEILQNLAKTRVEDQLLRNKMLVVADEILELNSQRNTIAHNKPYWWSPSLQEIGYFKDVNQTIPQIRVNPPLRVTLASLTEMCISMDRLEAWLSAYVQGVPWWEGDNFPWLDKLQRKIQNENRKAPRTPRTRKDPQQSSQE